MKLQFIGILFMLAFVVFCCDPGNKQEPLVRDCTQLDSCQAEISLIQTEKPVANTVRMKPKGKLRFVKTSDITEAIIIIPKADQIFEKLYSNTYDSVVVHNTTYLFINLTAEKKSKQFKIRKNTLAEQDTISYPYSVYLPQLNKMAESNSSPAIIVEP